MAILEKEITVVNKVIIILILNIVLNYSKFLLVNFYNSSSKPVQIHVLSAIQKLLEKINDFNNKNIMFGIDFNLIFDRKFNASGGNLVLRKDQ